MTDYSSSYPFSDIVKPVNFLLISDDEYRIAIKQLAAIYHRDK